MQDHLDYGAIKLDRKLPMPLFLQLADALQQQARNVRPSVDLRLKSERELALLLAVDRSTVHKAYAELLRRQFLERRAASGLYVSPAQRHMQVVPFPNIGLVVPYQFSRFVDRHNQLPLQYIKAIIDRASEKHLSTIMLQLPLANASGATIRDYLQSLHERLIGIVHFGSRPFTNDRPLQLLLQDRHLPQVIVSAYAAGYDNIGSIGANPEPGAQAMARHLRQLGMQKVGLLLWRFNPENVTSKQTMTYHSRQRYQKVLRVLEENGLECPEEYRLFRCQEQGYMFKHLQIMVQKKSLPDVFWCSNDEVAEQAIAALEELGARVPEDISVIGFDGQYQGYPGSDRLATVAIPFRAIGAKTVDLLLEYKERGINEDNRQILLPTAFIPGKSLKAKQIKEKF